MLVSLFFHETRERITRTRSFKFSSRAGTCFLWHGLTGDWWHIYFMNTSVNCTLITKEPSKKFMPSCKWLLLVNHYSLRRLSAKLVRITWRNLKWHTFDLRRPRGWFKQGKCYWLKSLIKSNVNYRLFQGIVLTSSWFSDKILKPLSCSWN